MSSEIYRHDVMVLGSNTPAWHGLGTVFPGRLSPLRVFAEGIGHRDILECPVVIDGQVLEGQKGLLAITAKGDRVPLSVVGEGYGTFKSEAMYKLLEEVYGGRAVVETAGTLRNGKREFVLVSREGWDLGNADKVLIYDLWINRHDGSGCFELHRTNIRVVCANTWKMAVGNGRNRVFGVRHTVNIADGIREACRLIQYVDDAEAVERKKVVEMARTPMSDGDALRFFDRLLGVDRTQKVSTRTFNQLESLYELFHDGKGNSGSTRWDAFNAVTEYVDHNRSSRVKGGRDEAEVRFESILMGSGDALKAKAFDYLTV